MIMFVYPRFLSVLVGGIVLGFMVTGSCPLYSWAVVWLMPGCLTGFIYLVVLCIQHFRGIVVWFDAVCCLLVIHVMVSLLESAVGV